MLLEVLSQNIISAIISADTTTALALLKEHQGWFTDPVEGIVLHSKALYYAIKNSKFEILQYLLQMPVSSDVPFFKFCGYTPISFAIEEGHPEVLPLLLTKTDKSFALHMAVNSNLAKSKAYLLSKCVFKEKLLKYLGLC
jgi:hypothetical protein